jgi:hypothetical protein
MQPMCIARVHIRAMHIAAIIASIDERTEQEGRRLARGMLAHAWPGGPADRHLPAAAEWVRRWGPHPGRPQPFDGSAN